MQPGAGYDHRRSYPAPVNFRLSADRTLAWRAGRFGTVMTCDFCGRQEADDAKTLTWSTSVENGRTKAYCDRCSREHLRAMEGKLDSEYW